MNKVITITHPRIKREKETIEKMIALYCLDHHGKKTGLCNKCQELLEYAHLRLSKCPFQENKTTCGNCQIHCYKPIFRKTVRIVMKYSGPRMIFHHPILAIGHILDGFRKTPTKINK